MTRTQGHMLVKATVTEATDEGTFTAVISTVSIDRDGDIVDPGAVVKALQAWAPNGKMVPLAWDHEYDADHIIGHIVPGSVHEKDGEVIADGWIDQSFDRGQHAWRLVKSGTLGFSYGYLITDADPRGDGKGLHITEMDIFEVTATPIPANADTRVVSYKSLAELKEATAALEQEEEARAIPEDIGDPPVLVVPDPIIVKPPDPVVVPDAAALRAAATATEREEQERHLPVVDPPPPEVAPDPAPVPVPVPLDADVLRAQAAALEREEEERLIPHVDPPPLPEQEVEVDPPPPAPVPPDPKALKSAAAAVERAEQERQLPEVIVVPAEPVVEKRTGVKDLMAQARDAGPTDEELLAFAEHILQEVGGKSLEDLEQQVKRLEREERTQREHAIVKSAEIEGVQAQIAEAHDAVVAMELFDPDEVAGMKNGTLTTVWTAAYIHDLPDSAFLRIEEGGTKKDGRTSPRDLRRFPYKTTNGVVDASHLRNALARIPESGLPKNVQERVTARAVRILDGSTVDATGHEKGAEGHGSRTVDPLRKQADDVALEHFSDGLDRRKPPRQAAPPQTPKPEHDLKSLRERMYEATLTLLSD